jgi:methionyl-tRNA formyltransferase
LFSTPSTYGERAFAELAGRHEVVAAVLPARSGSALGKVVRRWVPGAGRSRLEALAGDRVRFADAWEPIQEMLAAAPPDLICIALFPRRVPEAVVRLAPLGAINAHPSLLPRHRGPLPLFWTYHANDRLAGVTVHHASERLDAGDIILRDEFELPRGYSASALDARVADQAGPLLCAAAERLAAGDAPRTPQDESAATYAPVIEAGARMVDFKRWDVERVWHFLAALAPQYREPLADAGGAVEYRRVLGYDAGPAGHPGTVERCDGGWKLHCRGGVVRLGA